MPVIFTEEPQATTTELNECLSSPCYNNATCVPEFNGYSCQCADGYMGKSCQSKITHLTFRRALNVTIFRAMSRYVFKLQKLENRK